MYQYLLTSRLGKEGAELREETMRLKEKLEKEKAEMESKFNQENQV